ncbi:hypothetical protein BJ878DRAFT_527342 [Calycina marina]|uniref:Uncharacterized protein n=1 Tax=Calycina marina TaxID=1763456 RepID=A0A9P8CAS7_9HELO|nr:hypothetical protein BJ878DRAFT_527342 [Calycina marina]
MSDCAGAPFTSPKFRSLGHLSFLRRNGVNHDGVTPEAVSDGLNGDGKGGYKTESEDDHDGEQYGNVHGIIMATVVLILPIESLSMHVLERWWVHTAFQVLSLLSLIAGFGIGIYVAKTK